MPRKKEYEARINLPVTSEMLKQVDDSLRPGEPRLSLIREAIALEIERRREETKCSG